MAIHPLESQFKEAQIAALKQQLANAGLPVDTWTGEQGTKTVGDLFNEVEAGETNLVPQGTGELLRVVQVAVADIYYADPETGTRYRLREDCQVSRVDGSIKKRELLGAMSEKMKSEEGITAAVLRGIAEEILNIDPEGLSDDDDGGFTISSGEEVVDERNTETYPGLRSQYRMVVVTVEMPSGHFRPEGYMEEQETKIIYFVWDETDK